ncbi:hypothetical protein D3C75_1318800 [compost metagenome]
MLYASKETCLPSTKTLETEGVAVAVFDVFTAGSEVGTTGSAVGSVGFEVGSAGTGAEDSSPSDTK